MYAQPFNPSCIILPLEPRWQKEVKHLYDRAFAHATIPYGRQLPAAFLEKRVFGSLLWSSDCSRGVVTEAGEWVGLAIANRRRNPDSSEGEWLWLQLFCIAPAWQRQGMGRHLLQSLLATAAAEGKQGVVTSLQWAGIWPGMPVGLDAMRAFCLHTGAALSPGEIYLEKTLQEPEANDGEEGPLFQDGMRVVSYGHIHQEGLGVLLKEQFSVGWQQETLSRIDPAYEPFNGYGLADTFDPVAPGRGVLVAEYAGQVAGFCVVQAGEAPLTGFFGPIGLWPRWRGRGWGSRLMRAAIQYARGLGWERLGLWTSAPLADGFYIPLGWRTVSVTQQAEWRVVSTAFQV